MEISIGKTIRTCQRTDKTLSVFQGILPNGSWFWTWWLIILHHGLKITRCFSILGSFRVGVEVCVSAIPIICFSHVKYLQEDPNGWHSPILAKQRTPGGNGTGSHEPTCMVPGFEALHGSRLISEPTKLTPLPASKHLTNLPRVHGTPPSHPGTKPRLPWVEACRNIPVFFVLGWPARLPIFNSTLLLAATSCASNICSDWSPLFLPARFSYTSSDFMELCYPPQIPSWGNVSNMIAGHAKIQCWLVANFVDKSSHSVWQRKQFSGFCKISFTVFKELSKGVTPIWLSSSPENRREHRSRPCIKLPFLCWLRSEFAQVRVYKIWRSIWLRFCLFDGWQN